MRRGLAASAVVALVLTLAGCGGTPAPKPKPIATGTPSASVSATPTPPLVPKATKDKAGAIAFARVFIDAVNYAGRTGDTKPLRALYVANCVHCEDIADTIDKTYASGGKYVGGDWMPTSMKFYNIDAGVAYVDARVTYTAQTWISAKGKAPQHFAESKRNLEAFQLAWHGKGWTVGALDANA